MTGKQLAGGLRTLGVTVLSAHEADCAADAGVNLPGDCEVQIVAGRRGLLALNRWDESSQSVKRLGVFGTVADLAAFLNAL